MSTTLVSQGLSPVVFDAQAEILRTVSRRNAPPMASTSVWAASASAVAAAVGQSDYRSAISMALGGALRSRPIDVTLDESALNTVRPSEVHARSGASMLEQLERLELFLQREGLSHPNRSLVIVYGEHQGWPYSALQLVPIFTGLPTLLANSYLPLAEALQAGVAARPPAEGSPRLVLFAPEAHAQEACRALRHAAPPLASATLVSLTRSAHAPPPVCPGLQLSTTLAAIDTATEARPGGVRALAGALSRRHPHPGGARLVARQDDTGRVQIVEFGERSRRTVMESLGCLAPLVGLSLPRLDARIGPYSSGDAIVDDCRSLQGAPLASWPLGFARFEALVRRYPATSMQVTPPHLRWLREEYALKAALHARRTRAGRPSPLGSAGQLRFCAVGGLSSRRAVRRRPEAAARGGGVQRRAGGVGIVRDADGCSRRAALDQPLVPHRTRLWARGGGVDPPLVRPV